ncbi:MAG: hypothetical protein H0V76_06275 [Blastocatellia bacterium]|nr:hypothetical protein [Blastocatellia bacterium]
MPTIQQSDLVERNLTPGPRYAELNRILTALHGSDRLVICLRCGRMMLTAQDFLTVSTRLLEERLKEEPINGNIASTS